MRLSVFTFLLTCLIVGRSVFASSQCDEAPAAATASDSPKLSYFTQLLRKQTSPTLSELMVLWYPSRKGQPKYEETDWDRIDAGQIDTVYSWGPFTEKLLQRSMPDGLAWSGKPVPGMLDTVVSAIGSWGYGLVPVR